MNVMTNQTNLQSLRHQFSQAAMLMQARADAIGRVEATIENLQQIEGLTSDVLIEGENVTIHIRLDAANADIKADPAPQQGLDLPEASRIAEAKPVEPVPVARGVVSPAPAVAGDNFVTGAFTSLEKTRLIHWVSEGKSCSYMAQKLGRDPRGFHMKVKQLVGMKPNASPEAEQPSSKAETPEPPQVSHSTYRRIPENISPTDRTEWMRLNDIGNKDWSVNQDIRLVGILARGRGLSAAAGELRRSPEDCKARWNLLMPEQSIAAQQVLLRVLKFRQNSQVKQPAE